MMEWYSQLPLVADAVETIYQEKKVGRQDTIKMNTYGLARIGIRIAFVFYTVCFSFCNFISLQTF